jgi:protein arginine N-methyltransferase 1
LEYSLGSFACMISDATRTSAYAEALRQAITPGCVVLDIGTGVGIWALLACRLGAGRVYAIETSDVIEVARANAVANGYADRISFLQGASTGLELPERVDVVVADLHGALPLFEESLASIIDARRRFMVPSGHVIPARETMWVAVSEPGDLYREQFGPWFEAPCGVCVGAARRWAMDAQYKCRIGPEHLLVEPRPWGELDYATLESPDVFGRVEWVVARAGMAHGLSLWFDCLLWNGVSFSTGPAGTDTIYGRAFLPLSEPVPVASGDRIRLALGAKLLSGDYVWTWETEIFDGARSDRPKVHFKQSTFHGPFSRTKLRRAALRHRPSLGSDGQVDAFILTLMEGRLTIEEIASLVVSRFPHAVVDQRAVVSRVVDLSVKYSEDTLSEPV